jgi:hypothetical protein
MRGLQRLALSRVTSGFCGARSAKSKKPDQTAGLLLVLYRSIEGA